MGEGISMPSPNYLVFCCPLSYHVAPVFVQAGRLSTAWLVSLVVVSCNMVSRWWHVSSIGRLWGGWYALPRSISFFSHAEHYSYDFCPTNDPDVGPYILVRDVEHTSLHVGMCGRKVVLWLFVQCTSLCTTCHSWQHTSVVHTSLQTDGKVAFVDIPVFGMCRPSCHDYSLYIFVLVRFNEAVVLSQVHVPLDISYQHIVHLNTNSPNLIG